MGARSDWISSPEPLIDIGGLETKKSYRAYFRSEYGDGRVTYPLVAAANVESYDKIVLRAGFNDRLRRGRRYPAGPTQIRDQVIRDLHDDMGGVVAHGAWYVVYINMQYWGVYNVTERLDEDFLTSHLGEGAWEMIRTGESVVCGSIDGWRELARFVEEHDLSLPSNYDEVARRVDLEDFTRYVVLNVWRSHDGRVHDRGSRQLSLCLDRRRSAPRLLRSHPPGSRSADYGSVLRQAA